MLVILSFLFLIVCAGMIFLVPLFWSQEIFGRYRGTRAVTCPETQRQVAVTFDSWHAAVTALGGRADVRLNDCTRWPERAGCGQDCLPQALLAEPYTQGEVALPKTRKVYHLPVLVAGFAAWVLGMIWHSEYVFRGSWASALGAEPWEVRQMARWLSPHLLSLAAPLLFAYGVACALAFSRKRGIVAGLMAGFCGWGIVALASLLATNLLGLPQDLVWIEATYTFMASLLIGAIVGGLSGKLVMEKFGW